jgi:hypothetical protein
MCLTDLKPHSRGAAPSGKSAGPVPVGPGPDTAPVGAIAPASTPWAGVKRERLLTMIMSHGRAPPGVATVSLVSHGADRTGPGIYAKDRNGCVSTEHEKGKEPKIDQNCQKKIKISKEWGKGGTVVTAT